MNSPILQPLQSVPVLGQQQTAIKASLMQALHQLSTRIYATLAAEYVSSRLADGPDPAQLELLAKHSQQAAQSYFQGIGLATFQETPKSA